MASGTADADGKVTERTVEHYRRLAESGAGLVFVEYTYVDQSGKSEAAQLGIQTQGHLSGLRQIAEELRTAGALPAIQLTHAGGKTERDLVGDAMMGPSAVPVPVKDRALEAPRSMDAVDLARWRSAFVAGAMRAHAAGFAMIELHAAHGYGLNQWLSPLTNRRMDEYGGSFANRTRLLIEIVFAIRSAVPDLLLSVRMPGQDFLEGGLSAEEGARLAALLERSGVDLIDVSSGIGGWRRPGDRKGEGYLVPEARRIQDVVSVPVIGVGGIESGEYIDEALRDRSLSLAAVGRAILRDPSLWRRRNLACA